MAEVKNAFIKSKMNKDLDDRLIPSGEYRNAVNIQVSKSEGSDVGALENVLGNSSLQNFDSLTGVSGLSFIGLCVDNSTSIVYLFLTDYTDQEIINPVYSPSANNFIFSYNTLTSSSKLLVEGAFLNFSTTNSIYGVNILENLLFWTDNRNQPRKINVNLANEQNSAHPTYYTTEDQISVAKYNPYQTIQLYSVNVDSNLQTEEYESTMKDVVSLFYPNGGSGQTVSSTSTTAIINSFIGDIVLPSDNYDSGASVSYLDSNDELVKIAGATLDTATYNQGNSSWSITITGGTFPSLSAGQKLVFNANPYYNPEYSGDVNYLEDKYVRFGYRFNFFDGEESIFSTFTQAAFIPKQDGYFMYVKKDNISEVDDESNAFRSTVVSFVENKVNDIMLKIPLPFLNYNLKDSLKVSSIDILYKESDGLNVKVIASISINEITLSSSTSVTSEELVNSLELKVQNINGGVLPNQVVNGGGIVGKPTVVSFEYDAGSNNSGIITLSSLQTISVGTTITVGDPNFFTYNYQSKKPFKTLPSSDLIRVYDKVPVKALAQEIISNRVVYGNYQDKHTPPLNIDYNVLVSNKSSFNINKGSADINAVNGADSVTITNLSGSLSIGSKVVSSKAPVGTIVIGVDGSLLTFNNNVTFLVGDLIEFEPSSIAENTTSVVSYPSSSLKTNRTYQVAVVLSDRFGRQSSVVLSNNNKQLSVNGIQYSGTTIFSPYIDNTINPTTWIGNSIKLLFNNQIGTIKNNATGEPGVYNGDSTSLNYNPLGWYSYKIVVKQTQQEYYNVYLPGIMASYPEDTTLELGNTSHIVLINDNINKVPRDLSSVGPDQKIYRSSVKLFGRVQNSTEIIIESNKGLQNVQYYPNSRNDIVTTIATVNNLFNYDSADVPEPNFFPQFYSLESSPNIARINTSYKIGQIASTDYSTFSATISLTATTDSLRLVNVVGDTSNVSIGDIVSGPGFPSGLKVDLGGFTAGTAGPTGVQCSTGGTSDTIEISNGFNVFAGQSVTAVGIQEGSYILQVLQSPWRIVINTIASIASGAPMTFTNPSLLDVTASVSTVYGDSVNVSPDNAVGIQRLAVYETKPVESLLDIFWETSTTGLISDINNIVLNESASGVAASGINSYNTTPFTEALWPTFNIPDNIYPSIFTAPIYLVDSFGQAIPPGDINTGGELRILSVTNVYGTNVQTSNQTGPYFELSETSVGSYEYDLLITPAFIEDVYYGFDANLRVFSINFTSEVNDQVTTFNEVVSLTNEAPFVGNPFSGAPTTGPIFVENKRTTDQNIIDLAGSNGSGGPNGGTLGVPPPNVGRDLSWTKISEVNSYGTSSNYFLIDSTSGLITNTGYQNVNMPQSKYVVTVKLTDPTLFVNQDVIINMGLIVNQLQQRTITGTLAGTSTAYTATFFFLFVPLQPQQSYDQRNGWYVYTVGKQSVNGPWAACATTAVQEVITITTGNVASTCTDWKGSFPTTRNQLEQDIYTSQCVPSLNNGYAWTDGPVLNPDPINYTFEFS